MPRIQYRKFKFGPDKLARIQTVNDIIAEYAAQGFTLTLRQLFYQHVSRALMPNTDKSYKNLGDVVSEGRLAGLIDWNAIVDRTRMLRSLAHWSDPADIIDASLQSFRIDKWETQPYRIEVWIEKDALVGVIEDVCHELDVPFFSCRGYTSQTEMWAASQRLRSYMLRANKSQRQKPYILHFGDHDPSGKDMSRDIVDRLKEFNCPMEFERLALNMDQVERYDPPPNPAKITDSRAAGYIREFGDESWELDALEPSVIATLIRDQVTALRDAALWQEKVEEEERGRLLLDRTKEHWPEVVSFLDDKYTDDQDEDDEEDGDD